MAHMNVAPNSARVPTTPKAYVTVFARHELGGRIHPIAYRMDGGEPIKVDSITDERQAASLKSGGQGTRYTCRVIIEGVQSEVYLFHDEADWFMEPIMHQGGAVANAEPLHLQLRKKRRKPDCRRTRQRGCWRWTLLRIVGWRGSGGGFTNKALLITFLTDLANR